MKDKVFLFDSNDKKIGETFERRARQLVNRQRAEWVDGKTRSAIRFRPDEDFTAEASEASSDTTSEISSNEEELYDDNVIYVLMKRRQLRRDFIIHSVALVPGLLLIRLLFRDPYNFYDVPMAWVQGIFIGMWVMAYLTHINMFIKNYNGGRRPFVSGERKSKSERKAEKLADEVLKIKRMMKA